MVTSKKRKGLQMKRILFCLGLLMVITGFCEARTVTVSNDNGYYSYNGWVDNEGLTIEFEAPPKSFTLINDGDSTNNDARLYYGFDNVFDTDENYMLSGEEIEDNKNSSYYLFLEASDGDNDTFRLWGKE